MNAKASQGQMGRRQPPLRLPRRPRHPTPRRPTPTRHPSCATSSTSTPGTGSAPAPSPPTSTPRGIPNRTGNHGPDTPSAGSSPTPPTSATSPTATSRPRRPRRTHRPGHLPRAQRHRRTPAATPKPSAPRRLGDYHLTGLITCPHCGQRYIGTSANGRTRRYRYYTCFTRTRYGNTPPAPHPAPRRRSSTQILKALHDFYTTAKPSSPP